MSEPQTRRSDTEGEGHPIRLLTDDIFELAAKLALVGFLLYWSIRLIEPFLILAAWSVILTVSLYPVYEWASRVLGGRPKLAAAAVTVLSVLVFAGPAVWLGMNMAEAFETLSARLRDGAITVPPPPGQIKAWPLIGARFYDLWSLASVNAMAAFKEALPYLEPLAGAARKAALSAATGVPTFLLSMIIAGFLFPAAPGLLAGLRRLIQRMLPARGQEFVQLAGAAIRNVSRGVVGVAFLQAVLAGLGFMAAGIPGNGMLALAVLILGILQLPGAVLLPAVIWSWTSMPFATALAFTIYMIPVGLMDNVLRPIVMSHGMRTPMLVIFAGLMGGALEHGLIGLFLGPVVLAVTWELLVAWVKQGGSPSS